MSRDYRKLKVFELAHSAVQEVYRLTETLPQAEKYGLQSQIRRAAVSVATNIVEGCARTTERDYLHFINISFSSAAETGYLISLAASLKFLDEDAAAGLQEKYDHIGRSLFNLSRSVSRHHDH